MELFDKKYLYVEWDDCLDGKEVVFGDEIREIKEHIEEYKVGEILGKGEDECLTFRVKCEDGDAVPFRFAYYDPLLKYKIAYNKGKKVEMRFNEHSEWTQVNDKSVWTEVMEYRIVEEYGTTVITKQQLCMWLAKGNGVYRTAPDGTSRTVHEFNEENADDPADLCVEVRRWEDKEWHNPVVAYCFPETASPAQDGIGERR